MAFDLSKLPRRQLLEELFSRVGDAPPSTPKTVPCPLVDHHRHDHGDRPPAGTPSFFINPRSGGFHCKATDVQGEGWKDLVVGHLGGEERWAELVRACGGSGRRKGSKPTDAERQEEWLERTREHRYERAWTDLYGITEELSKRYLRQGRRFEGDPYSESVVCLWQGQRLAGLKYRLPDGRTWQVGNHKGSAEKYMVLPGTRLKEIILLGELAEERPEATLVICAGEKDALVAASHLSPVWAPVAVCGGETTVPTGLAELAEGRDVVIAYDADDAGRGGAHKLWGALRGRAKSCRVAVIPGGEGVKDVADVLLKFGVGRLIELLDDALEAPPDEWESIGARDRRLKAEARAAAGGGGAGDEGGGGDEPDETVAAALIRIAQDASDLFVSYRGKAYARLRVGETLRCLRLKDQRYRRWLARAYYREVGKVAAPAALTSVLQTLEGLADDGPRKQVYVRVANLGDRIYLDLVDEGWRVVEVTAKGWRVLEESPVPFVRSDGMLPLPEPQRGGSVDELWPLLNVPDGASWILVKAWLVGALRGEGPFWGLLLQGEQGSAKSSVARALRDLVDPHALPIRSAARDERDLMISANGSWVTCYDNLSGCPGWLSDALCRLLTGGGFATRALYADDEEALFFARRPVMLNGIDSLATRPDLADRCLIVHLPRIPEQDRREEGELEAKLEELRPRALGALLDAVACGLRRAGQVRLERLPRMADATKWVVAASPALGIPDAAFTEVLEVMQEEQDVVGAEADCVASAVISWINPGRPRWEGSSEDLLSLLEGHVGEAVARSKAWPKTRNHLVNRLIRVSPVIRRLGVEFERFREGDRSRGQRRIRLAYVGVGRAAGAAPF